MTILGNTVIAKVQVNNTSKKPTTKMVMKVIKHIDLRGKQISTRIFERT